MTQFNGGKRMTFVFSVIIALILVSLFFLDLKVSRLEKRVDSMDKDSIVDTIKNDDKFTTINEDTLTDTNLAYFGTQKTDMQFFIENLNVVNVDYGLGVISTDKVRIFLAKVDQSMYVRKGDTICLFGNFYSGTSTGTYIRNAVLYSVEFDDQVLHIKNEE